MLIRDILDDVAGKYPARTAMIFEDPDGEIPDRSYTYRQMQQRVNKVSNAVLQTVQPGDRIAIFSESCPEYVECILGVPSAGAALVLVNYRLHIEEILKIINDAEPVVLITENQFLEIVEAFRDRMPSVKKIIVIGGGEGVLDYEEWLRGASDKKPDLSVGEDEMAWLIYTSGTTGTPKGVMHTHKSILSGVAGITFEWPYEDNAVMLHPFPLFHITAFAPIFCFSRLCVFYLVRRFDPDCYLASIEKYKVTNAGLAPVLIKMLLEHPRLNEFDTSSLRMVGYSMSPIPAEVLKKAILHFGRPIFFQGYAMTEVAGNCLVLNARDHVLAHTVKPHVLEAVGKRKHMVPLRVVNEKMEDVAPGEVGEIIMRGDNLFKGYWRNPEATAAAFRDGWLYSGDLARIDEEGYVYIVDRAKDMIITGGENVYCLEVEQVLFQHPAVLEASVIGIPDDTWGENIMAVVVLRPGMQASENEIISFCKDKLAGYKKPKLVRFTDEIPKSATGKVLKRELRDQYR